MTELFVQGIVAGMVVAAFAFAWWFGGVINRYDENERREREERPE